VYAGPDPLTGKDRYLTESTKDQRQAERMRTRSSRREDAEAVGRLDHLTE
jgi:integrase